MQVEWQAPRLRQPWLFTGSRRTAPSSLIKAVCLALEVGLNPSGGFRVYFCWCKSSCNMRCAKKQRLHKIRQSLLNCKPQQHRIAVTGGHTSKPLQPCMDCQTQAELPQGWLNIHNYLTAAR